MNFRQSLIKILSIWYLSVLGKIQEKDALDVMKLDHGLLAKIEHWASKN